MILFRAHYIHLYIIHTHRYLTEHCSYSVEDAIQGQYCVLHNLMLYIVCLAFMHDCLAPLVDSTTGLYTSTGTHSTGLSHQHTIRESSRTRPASQQPTARVHIVTPPRNIPEASEIRTPVHSEHIAVSPMVCVFNIHLVCTKAVIILAYSKLDQLADEQLYDACSVCTIVHLNCCWLLHSLLCWI